MTRLEALTALLDHIERGATEGFVYFNGSLHPDLVWPAYNGSLDAAKELHEAVLPGVPWRLDSGNRAEILLAGLDDFGLLAVLKSFGVTNNHSPARAWLIAIIKALITVETKG